MKSAILTVAITCGLAVLSADSQTIQSTKGIERTPLVQEVRGLLDNCESRISARSEAEYGKRYAELKDVHDRFMNYMTNILTCVGFIVALIGIIVPVCAAVQTKSSLRQYEKDRDKIRQDIERMEERAAELERQVCSSKGEQYFQLARHSFEQYKVQRNVNTLENVVRDLAHAIGENVEAKDACGLKSSIAFLNVVLNKPVSADANLPKELEQHRTMIEQRLKKYGWGFSILDVRRVFEQGGVDEAQVGYSITNLEKIMGRFGV